MPTLSEEEAEELAALERELAELEGGDPAFADPEQFAAKDNDDDESHHEEEEDDNGNDDDDEHDDTHHEEEEEEDNDNDVTLKL